MVRVSWLLSVAVMGLGALGHPGGHGQAGACSGLVLPAETKRDRRPQARERGLRERGGGTAATEP